MSFHTNMKSISIAAALLVLSCYCLNSADAFQALPTSCSSTCNVPLLDTSMQQRKHAFPFELHAKKKKKSASKSKNKPLSGFGGETIEPCPCGSGDGYGKCCGRLHTDVNAYKTATAEQVVRARYSAYAKRQVDFIIASTHPLNKNFETDLTHWKETIKTNMYDNFELTRCAVVDEQYQGDDKATVAFIAELVQRDSKEKTGFMETSSFERAKTHGGWLYLDGTIESVPGIEVLTAGDDPSPEERANGGHSETIK